jgi:hypothetical protein
MSKIMSNEGAQAKYLDTNTLLALFEMNSIESKCNIEAAA